MQLFTFYTNALKVDSLLEPVENAVRTVERDARKYRKLCTSSPQEKLISRDTARHFKIPLP